MISLVVVWEDLSEQWNKKYMNPSIIGKHIVVGSKYTKTGKKRKRSSYVVRQVKSYDLPSKGLSGVVRTKMPIKKFRDKKKAISFASLLNKK